jgi:hypothetical protein
MRPIANLPLHPTRTSFGAIFPAHEHHQMMYLQLITIYKNLFDQIFFLVLLFALRIFFSSVQPRIGISSNYAPIGDSTHSGARRLRIRHTRLCPLHRLRRLHQLLLPHRLLPVSHRATKSTVSATRPIFSSTPPQLIKKAKFSSSKS